jgi:hypothetical protein
MSMPAKTPARFRSVLCLAAGLGTAARLVGCGGGTSHYSIRTFPTPEMANLAQTHVDTQNSYAIMANYNIRMMNSDFLRAAYWDRPSRLTPLPMPH